MGGEGGEEGGRGGVRKLGQIASEACAPSHQSSLTGTTRGWRVGESTMIGMEVSLSTRVMDMGIGAGGWDRVGSGQRAS